MAYELATAYVSLTVETKDMGRDIAKQFDDVQRQADKSGQGIGDRLASGMGKALKRGALVGGAAAGAALGTALYKGMGRLDGIEQAEAKLSGLGHSAQGTAQIMDNALTSVRGTAFGLEEAATVAASAVAAGIKPGQELERVLSLTGDAATIAGVSMAEMGDIFNKVASSNKMQGDVINQLNTAGIPIVQLLGEELGKTSEEITEMSRKGQIDFQMFADAMESGLGGAALKSGDTFRGALANMGAAAGRFGAEVLRPLHDQSKGWIGGLTDLIDDATERVKPLAAAFGAWLADATPKFAEFARSAADAFQAFRESSAVQGAIAQLKDTFFALVDTAKALGPALATIVESLGKASAAVGISAWNVFLSALESVAKIADVTLVPALRVLADLMERNQGLVNALAIGFAAFKTVPAIFSKMVTAFSPIGNVAKSAATQLKSVATATGGVADAGRFGSVQMGRFGTAIGTIGNNVPVIQRMQSAFYEGASGADRFGRMAGTAAAATTGLRSAASGVVNMLGGPLNVALIAGAGLFMAYSQASAEASRHQQTLAQRSREAAEAQGRMRKAFIEDGGQIASQGEVFAEFSSQVSDLRSNLQQDIGGKHSGVDRFRNAVLETVPILSFFSRGSVEASNEANSLALQSEKAAKAFDDLGFSNDRVASAITGSAAEWGALQSRLLSMGENGRIALGQIAPMRRQFEQLNRAAEALTPGSLAVSAAFRDIGDSAGDAASKSSALKKALDALAGDVPSLAEATADYADNLRDIEQATVGVWEASDGLGEVLLNNDGTLNTYEANGARLHETLMSLRDDTADMAMAGADMDEVWRRNAVAIEQLAEATGLTVPQLERIMESIGFMPEAINLAVEVDGKGQVVSDIAAIKTQFDAIDDGEPKVITVESVTEDVERKLKDANFELKKIEENGVQYVEIRPKTDDAIAGLSDVISGTVEVREKMDGLTGVFRKFAEWHGGPTVEVMGYAQAWQQLQHILDLSDDELKDVRIDSNATEVIELMKALKVDIEETPDGDFKITDNIPEVRARIEELKKPTRSTHTVTVNERLGNTIRRGNQVLALQRAMSHADGGITAFAQGGFLPDQATIEPGRGAGLVQWAEGETGGEAFIPLAPSKRGRSMQILEEVARRFGVGLTAFADGGIRAAISAARSKEGLPYVWGGTGPDGFDCSGFVGWLQQIVMGLSEVEAAGKRLYTTHSLLGGSTAGLVRGDDPNSPFRVGVNDGHMAATLAGHNVESGGASSPSSSGIGPGRAGADHPQFTARFHLPASLVAGGDGDSIDAYGISGSAWSEEDDRKLEDARLNLQSAIEARDRAYEQNKSDLDKQAADLRVQRAELDVRELEQKREGGGGASSMLVSAAPAIDGAMDDDAIRLRQAEIAVLDAQLSRDQTYSDPSSTTLDKEKADLAVYSAQNALAQAQQDASSGAEPGSVKEILQRFASDAVGIAYDSVWEIFGVSQPHWMDVAIPQPKKPGKPADVPSRDEALADANPTDDLDLPVARSDMDEWLKRQGIALHDEGGWLEPGLTLNLTRKPEAVLNPEQLEALYAVADMGNELRGKQPQTVINNHNNQQFMDQREVLNDVARQTTKALVRAGMAAL